MSVAITGGIYRGRKLKTDSRGNRVRPTSGKVRQALFNSLGDRVTGSTFVDLYAGSGAVGFEALSRGAAKVCLVEEHPEPFALLRSNGAELSKGDAADKADGELVLVKSDAVAFCRQQKSLAGKFDLVFLDPPFRMDFDPLWDHVKGILAPDGVCVIQYSSRVRPAWLEAADRVKKYGESSLAYLSLPGIVYL